MLTSSSLPSREQSIAILHEYVQNPSLRRHCYAVAIAMEAYARKFNENTELWWTTGLLHDFDYEKFPTIPEHAVEGVKILAEKGYPDEVIRGILSHADYTGVPRITPMQKTLFAVDELSGFLVALAKVRQDNFETMTAESVEKGLKKKGFAAGVNRDDVDKGVESLKIPRDEHFNFLIAALKEKKSLLGF